MRNMAKLRLKNQVDTLSEMCKRGSSATLELNESSAAAQSISPYIIVDTFCLLEHMRFIKCLLGSQQYVLIIPRAGELTIT